MEDRKNTMNISLTSGEWIKNDEENAGRPFVSAGFTDTDEVLSLRIYDMLNIMGIDRIMAEEMMYALYRAFNENRKADNALYCGIIDQYFDFREWHREHPDASLVKAKDLVLAEGMNMEALEFLFDQLARKFWRSPEYDSRKYRYWNYRELLEQKKEET